MKKNMDGDSGLQAASTNEADTRWDVFLADALDGLRSDIYEASKEMQKTSDEGNKVVSELNASLERINSYNCELNELKSRYSARLRQVSATLQSFEQQPEEHVNQ